MRRSILALLLMRLRLPLTASSLIGLVVRLWVKSGLLGLLELFLDAI
nr:MAG TPA: hypothetical protein [Bacteriophage sp.]